MTAERVISVRGGSQGTQHVLCLVPGRNLLTACGAFRARFGPLTSMEEDLLCLAASVYAADIAILRGTREAFTRTMQLVVPVSNAIAFVQAKRSIEYILCLLSGDNWDLRFEAYPGPTAAPGRWPEGSGTVVLFSGGIDSLAYAAEAIQEATPLFLVSHDSGNHVTRDSQRALATYLGRLSQGQLEHLTFRVRGQNHPKAAYPQDHEATQRVRSFLFVVLGALVARRAGCRTIVVMAENGQMAIHLPLTAARIGAFSTHTADPEVLAELSQVLSSLLHVNLQVKNPYVYCTKAEVARVLCQRHRAIIPRSVSCWRASRVQGTVHHCGQCVPCLARRIALEYNGVQVQEWARDLLAEDIPHLPSEDEGKRNLMDLLEFVATLSEDVSNDELCREFPDLRSPYIDEAMAADMYRRFAREATVVLERYPMVRRVMQGAGVA